MSKATEANFRWYGLDGNKMIFSIPDQYQTCADLSNGVSWLNQAADGSLIVNNVKLIGFDTEQFDINDNIESTCVNVSSTKTSTTASSTTSTTTSTTTTSTTTTTTSTTKATTTMKTPPPRPKCQTVFNSKPKSAKIEPSYNSRQAYDVKGLYQQAYGRKKLNGAKLEILSVEPETTGITRYENGELIVFATDSAIQSRLALISGTSNEGVVVTVTIGNQAEGCESDTSEIKLEIIPQKRAAVKGCDLTNPRTHSHEFEVMMKMSQNFSPTVIVEYEIMKIIRDTYNDATMDNIYMVKFEETKDQQDVINGYKMVWGNATFYNCENQCERNAIRTLTNKIVSVKPGDASNHIVEPNFHAKFKDASFDLTTVSARGIHACHADGEEASPIGEAGVDSKVIILIVLTIGALAVIVGCCWMRQKKNSNRGGQNTLGRKAKNVPVIMNDDNVDNENEKLVNNSRTNGLETRGSETLPPKPEPPTEQSISSPPSIMVTKTAEIQEPTERQ